MRKHRNSAPSLVLRDARGRVIEVEAPCDVYWRGRWHRGKVLEVRRLRIVVKVIPFSLAAPVRALVHPQQMVVLGPTYEDVGRESAARAAARAESVRSLPEPDPSEES